MPPSTEKAKAASRAWYRANRTRALAAAKLYQQRNAEKHRADDLKWQQANRRRTFAYTIKHRFGLTVEDWARMFNAQNGLCAICDAPFGSTKATRVCVDHCHRTGAVRALLCNGCNTSIGQFDDNPGALIRAAAYVARFQKGTK